MLDRILAILYEPITERLEALMATVEQLQSQLADAKTSLQDAISRVEDDVQHLKDQLGDTINPDDLEPISRGLADLKAATDALDPDPENPPPA